MADLELGARWVSIAFKDENHGAFSRVELTALAEGPEGPATPGPPSRSRDGRGVARMALVIQALVLGVVQGLTEFLPISSSGHLILVPWAFGWPIDAGQRPQHEMRGAHQRASIASGDSDISIALFHRFQRKPHGLDGALENRREGDVEAVAALLHELSSLSRFHDARFTQSDVGPAGESVFHVPDAFAMPQ